MDYICQNGSLFNFVSNIGIASTIETIWEPIIEGCAHNIGAKMVPKPDSVGAINKMIAPVWQGVWHCCHIFSKTRDAILD